MASPLRPAVARRGDVPPRSAGPGERARAEPRRGGRRLIDCAGVIVDTAQEAA